MRYDGGSQRCNACPARSIPYKMIKPVWIYLDACGSGNIGEILVADGVRRVTRTHLPDWPIRPGACIYEFALAGVLLGMFLAICLAWGRPSLVCCGDMGARGAVGRGARATAFGRTLSSALWRPSATRGVSIWIEYVRYTLNPPDPPSRMCPITDKPVLSDGVSVGILRLFFDISESRYLMFRAKFAYPADKP